MMLRIDTKSPIPPFEQLRGQLALTVSSGRLKPGDRLPTVRGLAEDLGLSNGTVARAYRELEAAGVVVGRGRQGTFVASAPAGLWSVAERERRLNDAAGEYVRLARRLGAESADALAAVQDALDKPSNSDRL